MRPAFWIAIVSAALLAACSRHEPAPEPVRAVRVQIVSAEPIAPQHEYAAEVRARTESHLGFRVGGKLVRRHVDLGDTVKAGQVLAQLDPGDLQLGQQAARAAVTAAQVSSRQADADLKRYRELRQQGFISSAELERHETAARSARAQLEQARAQADVQVNQTGYSRLVADAPGVVTAIHAEPGSVLEMGTPVLQLAVDGPRDVVFSVPESQLAAVRGSPSGALSVRLWGQDAPPPMPAKLREVSASADPTTRTFLVKADIGRADVKLGQTATVTLVARSAIAPRAITLPLGAVWEHEGGSAVWVLDRDSMTVKPQAVRVAGAQRNQVVVAEGLAPGQTVVTAGVHLLTPGQKVKLYVEPTAASAAPASIVRR